MLNACFEIILCPLFGPNGQYPRFNVIKKVEIKLQLGSQSFINSSLEPHQLDECGPV